MLELSQEIIDGICRDFAAFSDPGTQVNTSRSGLGVDLQWFRNGLDLKASLRATKADSIEVIFQDERYPYAGFLVSPHMADLRHLAAAMVRVHVARDFDPTRYIETSAEHDADPPRTGKATEIVSKLAVERLPRHATRVVFAHGEAGAGKSWVLCKIAHDQALAFEQGRTNLLFLYANAQGASLATFDQVIAQALDDYGARFTYHGVAPLTRHAALTVIFDGFDELLGSGGYGRAYSSLSDFLARLEGRGSLVASARSAFYEYQDFQRAAARYAGPLNYQLDPVRIQAWTRPEGIEYFRRRGITDASTAYGSFFRAGDDDGRVKPFFVAKVADLLLEGHRIDPDRRWLPQLLDAFVEREVDKIKISPNEPLLSKEQHFQLLTELAGEMWWQETGSVDINSLNIIGELYADLWGLSEHGRGVLIEKLPSYGFLSAVGEGERRRGFEHEMYLSYFLARYAKPLLLEGDDTQRSRFLSRGPLPIPMAEEFAALAEWRETEIRRLATVVTFRGPARESVAKENAGLLMAAVLDGRRDIPSRLVLVGLFVRSRPITGAFLRELLLRDCVLQNVDLRDTEFENLLLENTVLLSPHVSPDTTRFTGSVLRVNEDVVGLVVPDAGPDPIYDSELLAKYLRRMGATTPGFDDTAAREPSAVASRRADLLKRFVRRARRQFYVSRQDDVLQRVFGDPEWSTVERLLREHGILTEKIIAKSGPREPLLMLTVDAEDLLKGEDRASTKLPMQIRQLWAEIFK